MSSIVAITAALKAFEHGWVVSLTVAFLALHELPMFGMTLRTCQKRVFRLAGAELIHRLFVASRTRFLRRSHRIGDNQWFVDRMTGQTIGIGLSWLMWFVTCRADRYEAVFSMALGTCQVGMLALVGLQFRRHRAMTTGTPGIHSRSRHFIGWGMGVGMAFSTFGQFLSVSKAVTGGTLRKDVFVGDLARSVSVELTVAVCALQLVLATVFANDIIVGRMALRALIGCQGRYFFLVGPGYFHGGRCRCLLWCGGHRRGLSRTGCCTRSRTHMLLRTTQEY